MSSGASTDSPRVGPFDVCLDDKLLRDYPAVAIATQTWDAQNEARVALTPADVQRRAPGGVHGEHDIVLHRPIDAGEPLRIWVDRWGVRPAGRNSLVTLRYIALDADGRVVAEQWWTTVYFATTCDPMGSAPPDHAFPERAALIETSTAEIDRDMPRRYAEVSGDWSAHHFEVEAARQSGFDRPFLHGLSTMALCTRAVMQAAVAGEVDRLRRVAVRFASPAFVGEQLDVRIYDAGPLGYAFEADSAGATVITHGRLELS